MLLNSTFQTPETICLKVNNVVCVESQIPKKSQGERQVLTLCVLQCVLYVPHISSTVGNVLMYLLVWKARRYFCSVFQWSDISGCPEVWEG